MAQDRGIHTVEGTASRRAAGLAMQREDEQKAFEERREALKKERRGLEHIGERFRSAEKQTHIARSTVGLMTLEQYKAAMRAEDEPAEEDDAAKRESEAEKQRQLKDARQRKRKLEQQKLSFEDDEEEEEVRSHVKKCPHVDTDFLPDAERDEARRRERERERKEELARQEAERKELFEISFTYCDGKDSKKIAVAKGGTVGDALAEARTLLLLDDDKAELRHTPVEALHFVRCDLMLPHHLCLYDLALGKVHGRRAASSKKKKSSSKLLFDFSSSGGGDAEETKHEATVVTRAWYDANKHIFPASRWQVYTAMNSSVPATS